MTRIKKCCIFATLINQNSSYMETTKKQPNHYRVAYCDEIFPTLSSAKKYVYINCNPQESPLMDDTYIIGFSSDGEPLTFTRVVASRSVFKFEKTFGLYLCKFN